MNNLDEVVKVFINGGIVIFPTDTVWGIGCRLDNKESVEKLFAIRKRPENKAVIALVDSIDMAQKYLQPIPQSVKEEILNVFWPQHPDSSTMQGGLTVILPCKQEQIPSLARGNSNTLAMRVPNHPGLRAIITKVGVPILAPSANFAGEKTPKSFEEIDENLLSLVDFVMEGKSMGALPSTIVDCSVRPWKIIRQGEVLLNI